MTVAERRYEINRAHDKVAVRMLMFAGEGDLEYWAQLRQEFQELQSRHPKEPLAERR